METVIEIPENQKYILCLLDSQGKPIRYIVFNGNSEPMTDESIKQKIFSKDDRLLFDKIPQPEFHNSSQQIHKDDTVRTIKKKIIHELGKNEICYEEIYLFAHQYQNVDPVKVINQEKELFTSKLMSQFSINIQLDKTSYSELKSMDKSSYNYEDIVKYVNKDKKYKISIPLGQRFSNSRNLLFSGNPYDVQLQKGDPEPAFQVTKGNELYTFENQLLLNYGEIVKNVIYVCKAGDVFDYASATEYKYIDGTSQEKMVINESYMSQLYFPLLNKLNIKNKEEFIRQQQEFIERNNSLLKPGTFQLYDTIDLFYNIYNNRKTELSYLENGVSSFTIVLHPDVDIPLPLDIVFKQIHATKGTDNPYYYPGVPLIKYNPGKRRESMFRFYSESISKDGKKIPWLSRKKINAISKENKKSNQITMYIQYKTAKNESIDLFLDIQENGNLKIRSVLDKLVSIPLLETIIYNVTNPIIIKINKILEKSGYKIKRFNRLTDLNVEIISIKQNLKILVNKPLNLKKIIGCLTSIFDIVDTELDVSKGLLLNFIRVPNYQKMNAMASMITDIFKRTNSRNEIVNALIINFSLTKEEAMDEIVNYFNQHQRIHGEFVNKQIDIVDNPGFPVSFYKSPFDNKLEIIIDQINSIEFINILNVYIDTILRLVLLPEDIPQPLQTSSNMLCSKINKVEEEIQIENVILNTSTLPLKPGVDSQEDEDEDDRYLPDDDEEEEEELVETDKPENVEEDGNIVIAEADNDDDDDEGYLPEEDDEEESRGGAKGEREVKTNMFTKRMMEKEPDLILKKPQGKYVSYSRVCASNVSLQPVILTDEEKKEIDKEHSGAYTNAIKYGSDPKKQFWYICPRYWCLKTNKPMTEEEVKRGECGGKIVKDNAKPPDPGHFIIEFTDDKYHKKEDGSYDWHSPGFKPSHTHPNPNFCVPCCFKNWASKNKNLSQQQTRRQQCGLVDVNINKIGPDGKKAQESYQTIPKDGNEQAVVLNKPKEDTEVKKEKERKKQEGKSNIFGIERYPIPQYRWGFLPISVERFLHTKNNKFVLKSNPAYIQAGKRPLLRYGIESSNNQSFIGVIADIYSSYKKIKLLSIEQMREKIVELLTLDHYLKLHNGSLTSIFKPRKFSIDDADVEDYKETYFYKQTDLSNPSQYAFLKDSISSFQNFQSYLKDGDSNIDHTYLWDVITSEESVLFEGGLNMVIIEILNNDVTDNIDVICPTNSYSSSVYNKDRGSILILKHDDFYEPIYLYQGKDKTDGDQPVRIFERFQGPEELRNMKKIFNMVMDLSEKKCKPMKTRPREYEFKENISAKLLFDAVTELGYKVEFQVMNYNGKVIAIVVKTKEDIPIYLPCFPSNALPKIEYKMMNLVDWLDYKSTRDLLEKINRESNGKILCKPMMKVMEDGLIVGILTITNQFIQINEPTQDIFDNDLPIYQGMGYGNNTIDTVLATSKKEDDLRVNSIRNITLETQFYLSFRTEIRNLLNNYSYREIREQIIAILDNPTFLYTSKMKKIDILLRHLTRNSFTFINDIGLDIKNKVIELSKGDVKTFCLKKTGKICFPDKNLINPETDNNTFYFARVCDELIRYKRIRLFMFDDKRYLNISNVDYSIEDDEVLLLNSVLTDEYFEDLVPFQNNKYVQNINYDIANPSKNTGFYQHFSNDIPLNEQKIES
jgi:hypothetical protein